MLFFSFIWLSTAFLLHFVSNYLFYKWLALRTGLTFLVISIIPYIVIFLSTWILKGLGDIGFVPYLLKFHMHKFFYSAGVPYLGAIILTFLLIQFKPVKTKALP